MSNQTARTRNLICVFVLRSLDKTGFLMTRVRYGFRDGDAFSPCIVKTNVSLLFVYANAHRIGTNRKRLCRLSTWRPANLIVNVLNLTSDNLYSGRISNCWRAGKIVSCQHQDFNLS